MKAREHRMKAHSTEASLRLPAISLDWGCLVQYTSHILLNDLKIRRACYWTQMFRCSASSSEFHRKIFWRSAGRKRFSRSALPQLLMRLRHFRTPESKLLPLPALKPADIADHFSERRRIRSPVLCRWYHRSLTSSTCR